MTSSAIANPYFNSNSINAVFGGPADFQLGSSFNGLNPVYPGECPGGAACIRGAGDFNTAVLVPEPASCALQMAGLGAVALIARRRA